MIELATGSRGLGWPVQWTDPAKALRFTNYLELEGPCLRTVRT